MKYKVGDKVTLKEDYEHDQSGLHIPKGANGIVINVFRFLTEYRVDFGTYGVVQLPERKLE